MKKILLVFMVVLLMAGCSGKFWAGTGGGVLGAGAAYEIHLERQMRKIDDDLNSGKIEQTEYDIRKSQIERDSLIK